MLCLHEKKDFNTGFLNAQALLLHRLNQQCMRGVQEYCQSGLDPLAQIQAGMASKQQEVGQNLLSNSISPRPFKQ